MLLLAAATLFAVYLLLLALLWTGQERIVFQPPTFRFPARLGDEGGVPVRQVSYRAADGADVHGYLVGHPGPNRALLIAFHGNADLARNLVPWAAEVLRRTGAAVLLPELRGYDGLSGRPTYINAANDARGALRFARDSLHASDDRLAYFGHSLGSAIATELACEHAPETLVLQSPLSSARAMARRMFFPGITLLWPLVSRVHYDTIDRVRGLPVPVWVSHGDRDLIIPAWMGREVFAAAAVQGELLIVRRAGHNDVADRAGEKYWEWIARALAVVTSDQRQPTKPPVEDAGG